MKLKKLEIANAIMPTTVLYSTLSGSRLFRHFPGWPYLLLILLVAPILALWTITWPNIHQTTSGLYETSAPKTSLLTQQNCASIESAIANATRYLLDHRNPVQGYFSYVIQPDGTEISNDYNILRHAGVMYALAMRYERKPSPEIRETLDKAIKYLRLYISPFGENTTKQSSRSIHAVWNYPPFPSAANQITNWYFNESSPVAQLGGAGLSLVAYSYITRSLKGDLPIAILDDHIPLARFIAKLQDPNTGRFFSRWFADAPVPDSQFDSLYYPGEAALGLYLLQDLLAAQTQSSPDLDWIDLTAMHGLSFLANVRDHLPIPSYPNDHWALLATERAVPLWNRVWNSTASQYINRVVTREKIVTHAMRVGLSMLQLQIRDDRNPVVDGALVVDNQAVLDVIELVARTTPTATRVEGLVALWKTLAWLDKEEIEKKDPTRAEIMEEIRKGLDRAVAFLLRAQIKKGKLVGGIPAGVSMVYLNMSSLNDVRMDYVQHAMSGWMSYKEMFCL